MLRRNRPAWRGIGEELMQYFQQKRWLPEEAAAAQGGCTWIELAVDYESVTGTLLPPSVGRRGAQHDRGYLGALSLAGRAQAMRARLERRSREARCDVGWKGVEGGGVGDQDADLAVKSAARRGVELRASAEGARAQRVAQRWSGLERRTCGRGGRGAREVVLEATPRT